MKKLLITAAIALLAGCANQPVSFSEAQPVPADRIYAFQAPADSTVFVTRDSGLLGVALKTNLYIDGILAAKFSSGESASFGVTQGSHIMGVKADIGGGMLSEREITVKLGDRPHQRIVVMMDHVDIMPTTH